MRYSSFNMIMLFTINEANRYQAFRIVASLETTLGYSVESYPLDIDG